MVAFHPEAVTAENAGVGEGHVGGGAEALSVVEVQTCPFLVGRERERQAVRAALDRLERDGRGAAVLFAGEAGIGKSRLAREGAADAEARGLPVLWGRCPEPDPPSVPTLSVSGAAAAAATTPFRPLVELVAAATRRLGAQGVGADVAPYCPALARLVPMSGVALSPDASPAVLGEGVLRLLAGFTGVAIIEDLHGADVDTLAVVEYLVDNVAAVPAVLIITMRDEQASPAAASIRRLARRGAVAVHELARMTTADVGRMAAGCLGLGPHADPPERVTGMLEEAADGLPLLVEDLLALAFRDGRLVGGADGWRLERGDGLAQGVPSSFADTVVPRLAGLGEPAGRVLRAAAVFGRSFPWELLMPVTGLDEATVLDALRAAVGAGLVVAGGDGFAFRHALTAAAVLDTLLPPERVRLCRAAADALVEAHPEADGHWCLQLAGLRQDAGQRAEAARLLLVAGRRALAAGAVAGAAALLERAASVSASVSVSVSAAASAGQAPLGAEVGLALLEAAAATGDAARCAEVGQRVLTILEAGKGEHDHGAVWLVQAHLMLARGALGADPDRAATHVHAAREAAAGDRAAGARVDALDALVVLESNRPDRLDVAAHLAAGAVVAAAEAGLPEVVCEASEVIGRCARVRDLVGAEAAFTRQLTTAEAAGLVMWRIRALNELGTIDLLRDFDPRCLQAAHDAAVEAGALVLAAGYSINQAAYYLMRYQVDDALAVARACEATARRFGAGQLATTAVVFQAAAAARRGRRAEMEAELARAGDITHGDISVTVWSMCWAILALLEEDRAAALDAYQKAYAAVRHRPALMTDPFRGQWLLVQLVSGTADEADLGLLAGLVPGSLWYRMHVGFCGAVVAGRAGRPADAAASLRDGLRAADHYPLHRHLYLRLIAEAALADGWGEPAEWLVEAEAWFIVHGFGRATAACRRLLRHAGIPVGRGGQAEAHVPVELRRLGVTAREAEVLELAAGRLTNREIAQALFLSPRTVEKHVASLLGKLGLASRAELGRWARPGG